MSSDFICYAFALVFFILAALGVPSGRFSFIGAGLAFTTLAVMF